LRRGRRQGSSGETPDSPYFWGDLCAQHVEYVRNLTFRSLNLLAANPQMPYRLTSTPYVAHWFSTADAADAVLFKHRVTRERLDRLEEQGGACIISTHLGKKFARDGRLDPEIDELFGYIASKPGWFVPVSTLLDYLKEHCPGAGRSLGHLELFWLECRYLVDQAVSRLTDPSGTYP